MAASKAKTLPQFSSLDEMVDFFDTTDLGDYLDAMPEVDFNINLKHSRHLISIAPDLADKVTKIAKSRHVTTEELIDEWLRAKVVEAA